MGERDTLRYDRTLSEEKRVITGSFYTPEPISKLMCALVLSQHLANKENVSSKLLFKSFACGQILPYSDFERICKAIRALYLIDLCAGTGAFPLAYFDTLEKWFWLHKPDSEALKDFLEPVINHFVVIDIQAEPLEVYKSELQSRYAVDLLSVPVFCFDALVDEAFAMQLSPVGQWQGGFDIVLGNPPYLGEKSHKSIFQALRLQGFGSRYYEGRMDYFYYFIYRALELLKDQGSLCYITTNYFATADGARKLREYLQHQGSFLSVVNFNDAILFKDAMGQHNAAYVYQKGARNTEMNLYYPKARTSSLESLTQSISDGVSVSEWQFEQISANKLYNENQHICLVPLDAHQQILEKISLEPLADGSLKNRLRLGDAFHVQQGIVSGFDKLKTQGVFVLSQEELEAKAVLKPYIKAFYKNKQVRRYRVLKPAGYGILYLDGKEGSLPDVVRDHLTPFRERLSKRREVEKGIRPWYALQWPREAWRFEGPLIATPQRAFVNVFAYEANDLYGSADIYYISSKDRLSYLKESTLFMTGYLNSLVVFYWLHLKGKRKGSMLELYATPLKEVPILSFESHYEQFMPIVREVEMLIKLLSKTDMNASERYLIKQKQEYLDHWYASALGLSDQEILHMKTYKTHCGAESHEESYWDVGTL